MSLPAPLTDADRFQGAIEVGADLLGENQALQGRVRKLEKHLKLVQRSVDVWVKRAEELEGEVNRLKARSTPTSQE